MAFIWKGLCSVATKAWNFAAPLLGSIAGKSLKQVGDDLTGKNSEQALATLNSREKQLNDQISVMENKFQTLEKDFQNRQNDFSEKQRRLDTTAQRLLMEQESLKRAEAELENRQRRIDNNRETSALELYNNTEKQVAEVRECLSQELVKYERAQEKLIKKQTEEAREYAEHRQRLEEDLETLKQNQHQIIDLLKTLPAIMKVKELHALTDVFAHNCKVFADDPDAMVEETRIMQRDYTKKLMEVRNVMRDGHFFSGSMRVWADGAVLDLHMLGFLVTKDVFSYKVVENAKNEYQGYWDNLKVVYMRHNRQVTKGPDRIQEIEFLLESQFRNFDTLMIKSMPSAAALPPALVAPHEDMFQSSSSRAFGAAWDQTDRSMPRRNGRSVRERGPHRRSSSPGTESARWRDASPSRNDDRLRSLEQKFAALKSDGRHGGPRSDARDLTEQHKTSRSSSRKFTDVPSPGGSARNRGSGFDQGRREKQRYSQDRQENATVSSSSRNKQAPDMNCRENLDFGDQQDFQGSHHSFRNRQEYHVGRDGPENRQPCRKKYQERSHFPKDQQDSLEESGSSSDDQVRPYEDKRRSNFSK